MTLYTHPKQKEVLIKVQIILRNEILQVLTKFRSSFLLLFKQWSFIESNVSAASSTNPNFKTTLCANFITNGVCSHGDECQYAHGRHELREKVLIPLSEEVIEKKKHEKISKMPGKTCLIFRFNVHFFRSWSHRF